MICSFCGTDFTPKRPHGRFCGTDCRRRAQNWRRRVARAEDLAEALAEKQARIEAQNAGSPEARGQAAWLAGARSGSSSADQSGSLARVAGWGSGRSAGGSAGRYSEDFAGGTAGGTSGRSAGDSAGHAAALHEGQMIGRAGDRAGAAPQNRADRVLKRERRRCRREELSELGVGRVYHAGKSGEKVELPEPGDIRISAELAWQSQLSAPWTHAEYLTPDGRLFWLITQGDVPDLPLSDLEHWTPDQMLEASALGWPL